MASSELYETFSLPQRREACCNTAAARQRGVITRDDAVCEFAPLAPRGNATWRPAMAVSWFWERAVPAALVDPSSHPRSSVRPENVSAHGVGEAGQESIEFKLLRSAWRKGSKLALELVLSRHGAFARQAGISRPIHK